MQWWLRAMSNYIGFSGRARRSEYWYFVLFNFIFACIAYILSFLLFHNVMLYTLFALATLLPAIAVTVRRLHDTGRSGWWWLIAFVPLLGAILLIVYNVEDSQPGTNQYGPNPKAVEAATAPA